MRKISYALQLFVTDVFYCSNVPRPRVTLIIRHICESVYSAQALSGRRMYLIAYELVQCVNIIVRVLYLKYIIEGNLLSNNPRYHNRPSVVPPIRQYVSAGLTLSTSES